MKKATKHLLSIILMLGMGMASSNKAHASPANFGVSFQVFYNELSPYGDWVMDPTYGYVWVPYVEQGFQPYVTNGYWTMTNFGNTWVSHYDWGWAPFHYGRWHWSNYYGWAWIPGYEWGPAWVSWRTGGGYYGWAPLGPGMNIGIHINIPARHWVFIPQRRFRAGYYHRYMVPYYNVTHVYNRTTFINNTYVYNNTTYYTGPNRREIERVTRTSVPVYQVNNSSKPGRAIVQNNSVNVYRPQISNARGNQENVRPSRAFTVEEYNQRSAVQRRNAQPQAGRSFQATPSRNEQGRNNGPVVQNRNNTRVNANPNNNRNNENINRTAPSVNKNSQATRPNNSSNQKANAALRGSSQNKQNSNMKSNTSVGRSPNATQQKKDAVRNSTPARQNNNAMRGSSPTKQNNSSVRSSSASGKTSPAVRSSSGTSSRNNSGTVSRSNSSSSSRATASQRGGRNN
ncbi:DUF6600 domain-containing protein [Shivajiella indica]|uniref:DUF6600 domain-containing protein n=1 Tax=Shivajiella indica TaxID=872115 RepID=A0ABW5B971_9BACT